MQCLPNEDAVEEWCLVPGFEGAYEVSNLGRVRSLDRIIQCKDSWGSPCDKSIKGRMLRPGLASNGYLTVCLNREGARYSTPIQYLVAAAFIGHRPEGLEVCHNDGVRVNNRLGNLRYDTPKGNQADKAIHGTLKRGLDNRGVLTDEDVRFIRSKHYLISQSELARQFNVSPACVQAVHDGRTYRHVDALSY